MKVLVAALMTALLVFAMATTWIDIVQPQLQLMARSTTKQAAEERAAEEMDPAPLRSRTRRVKSTAVVESLDEPAVSTDASGTSVAQSSPSLPRVRETSIPEAPRQLLEERLEDVKQRELRLAARQESLRMIYDDIRSELATVEQLRQRTADDLAAAERRVVDTARLRSPVARISPGAPPVMSATSEPADVPKTAFGRPTSSATAFLIRRMAETGKVETAISMLKAMPVRDAAKVLGDISTVDKGLAVRLSDSIQSSREQPVLR